MNKSGDLAKARAAWIDAKLRADEAQEAARVADDTACQLYADYAEIEQPGFAIFFRRLLKRRQLIMGIAEDAR